MNLYIGSLQSVKMDRSYAYYLGVGRILHLDLTPISRHKHKISPRHKILFSVWGDIHG
jgi:hypothetical protein